MHFGVYLKQPPQKAFVEVLETISDDSVKSLGWRFCPEQVAKELSVPAADICVFSIYKSDDLSKRLRCVVRSLYKTRENRAVD